MIAASEPVVSYAFSRLECDQIFSVNYFCNYLMLFANKWRRCRAIIIRILCVSQRNMLRVEDKQF